MLPTYGLTSGATDADNARHGPLMTVRKAQAGSGPPATGLIFLTAACCVMLVFQARCSAIGRRVPSCTGRLLPRGGRCVPPPLPPTRRPAAPTNTLATSLALQLWFSNTGARQGGQYDADGMSSGQRRALAAARRAGSGTALHRKGQERSFPVSHLRNLVLVACHSVYTGLDFHESEEKSSWFLLDYQKVGSLL